MYSSCTVFNFLICCFALVSIQFMLEILWSMTSCIFVVTECKTEKVRIFFELCDVFLNPMILLTCNDAVSWSRYVHKFLIMNSFLLLLIQPCLYHNITVFCSIIIWNCVGKNCYPLSENCMIFCHIFTFICRLGCVKRWNRIRMKIVCSLGAFGVVYTCILWREVCLNGQNSLYFMYTTLPLLQAECIHRFRFRLSCYSHCGLNHNVLFVQNLHNSIS